MPAAMRHRVLYATPEIADYVKSGGLGEVSATLPRALMARCDVRVLIPGYRQVLARHAAIEVVGELPGSGAIPACKLGRVTGKGGLVIYILLCPALFDRPGTPYGDETGREFPDNDIRFARLSLAAADMAAGLGDRDWRPDFLHLNDWPTALAPAYARFRGIDVPSLLTIHNLAYQGVFGRERLEALAIPQEAYDINGVEFYGKVSFLKAGLFYASHITTVSETYAREITRPELGCGLHGLLQQRAREGRLTGILNGIEAGWDPHCEVKAAGVSDSNAWKDHNAGMVRGAMGLEASKGPLFAIISRLVHQKGVDLAIEAAEDIVRHGGQLVVTGRGEARFEQAMRGLASRHPGHVGVRIGFDQAEARRMYAGSDFLLMPSRFEPCGLSQMYAQRFGSLPIAHRTGGLADTVDDGATGFLFSEMSVASLRNAIARAFDTFGCHVRLSRMRQRAMARSFDWTQSAKSYAAAYDHARAAA